MGNIDEKTVEGFGEEWSEFSQETLSAPELQRLFDNYFHIFRWEQLPENPVGFDMGCGSGRWAKRVAPRVALLHCIDASDRALDVARNNLKGQANCQFHRASFEAIPLESRSMDFGYSLGVLHHIPDTLSGLRACADKLKPGAPFLAYIYYAFDNKPIWYRAVWKLSDILRRGISRLPFSLRLIVSQIIAAAVYFPLARLSLILEKLGVAVSNIPLSIYRHLSFYSMRTDALDRFGTQLEKRFTRAEIQELFVTAGLESITFHAGPPYWCVVGYKRPPDDAISRTSEI